MLESAEGRDELRVSIDIRGAEARFRKIRGEEALGGDGYNFLVVFVVGMVWIEARTGVGLIAEAEM